MAEKRFTSSTYQDALSGVYDGKENLTVDECCNLLNQLDEDNKQYKILVESLKNENQKLKLRLKDLGVEYF